MIRGGHAVAVALVALAGCTGGSTTTGDQDPDATNATAGTSSCETVETPPLQVGQHLIGDAEPPGTYSSTPPTSGWHTSTVPQPGRSPAPLRDPEIVSALENGLVVAAVDPTVLADTDSDVVGGLVAQFPDRLVVTAYEGDAPTSVALLTWGKVQRCDLLDPAAVTSFVLVERVAPDEH